jgi:hypothetical protein
MSRNRIFQKQSKATKNGGNGALKVHAILILLATKQLLI